jgi:hypothetical protein
MSAFFIIVNNLFLIIRLVKLLNDYINDTLMEFRREGEICVVELLLLYEVIMACKI